MIKYFCDKCEKELEDYDIFTITVTLPEIRRWDDNARTGDCILCRECLDAFQGWLGLKKTNGDPVPAARRGSWEVRPAPEDDRVLGRRRYYCSECGGWNTYGESDFCPRCGADMRRDEMITDCPWR